ncbi:GyrI-like domain-containing protein [Brevibacterium sp. RIT 803]|uniref:GyrI-like domain-containing protein n=1 Tax=Brevibacterium sp. RIT 803 TaxID=2810210 RepID=UPI001950E6DB|nr:GyrI-like domain-containing protein [Brevibacterium sp. RIT 803]MBM6589727.1 GyrI-like domain-containing protein [Brevibacterium sp. RIT 803]
MDKIDVKKSMPSYRARRGSFELVEVPPLQYLMLDGHGDPNSSPDFASAIATLYPLAYSLKFFSRNELGRDYVVPPLEGLWWAEDMSTFTSARDKTQWDFTLMLLVPDWLNRSHLDHAIAVATGRRPLPRLDDVRFDILREGTCMQTLHVGAFDDEAAVLDHMHSAAIPAAGFEMTGRHHEIYLSDLRRSAPEKLRTILRQPVQTPPLGSYADE